MSRPDAAAVRQELERVLASALFVNAGRLSRLLRFTVERTLEGDAERLKEYVLGLEVFDRDDQYDPRLDSIVRVEARRLRARLTEYYSGPGLSDSVVIRFEKGGYAPQFEWRPPVAAPAASASGIDTAPGAQSSGAGAAAHRRRSWTWPIGAGILAGLLLLWVFRTLPATHVAGQAPAPATLAVLPLAHFGEDAAQDALADRLTDGIITELGRVPSLRVISRTSVMRYKGTRRPLREVAADLTAHVILEGSVLTDGGRVQVKARLVDAATDTKFWADIFQSEPDRLFELQRQIAQAVTAAMERRAANDE
jgi:TolB-like protein